MLFFNVLQAKLCHQHNMLISVLFACLRVLACILDYDVAHVSELFLQELTLTHPNIVNAKKNTELTYGKGTFLSNHQ